MAYFPLFVCVLIETIFEKREFLEKNLARMNSEPSFIS